MGDSDSYHYADAQAILNNVQPEIEVGCDEPAEEQMLDNRSQRTVIRNPKYFNENFVNK